ncbi:histone-fold-containing protein [Aspergillus campestris IBT 28561]|uniref:Histone-fold-containing protein n=1 Tax=Aspergillus campestris (strain IBT 28561) TaxID=1392248 RepID=A0A2I1D1M4_ASPC2|nr:histone-fold-containing protein [Aspergillus campestris IBT 28561]PKY03766.1 histone-fold-containing protein [Aspergillus campestris IBT 28561]
MSLKESEEITGQSALPIARIKKIIQLDDDIVQCSSNATFVIAMATEQFIQHLTTQAHNVVKSERKPRKGIQYKDLATAVSRIDNLEFLSDVIPKTTTYKQFKEKRGRDSTATGPSTDIEKGQRTLNGAAGDRQSTLDDAALEEELERDQAGEGNEESSPRAPVVMHASGAVSTLVVDRGVEGRQKKRQSGGGDEDVEMVSFYS